MRKLIALAIVLAFGLAPTFTGSTMAQQKHASKPVWRAMVASLNDIQSITAALMVFDMKRAATIADGLAKRETFISNIKRLSEKTRKGHARVAVAAKELVDAIKTGTEQTVAVKIGGVIAACSSCHYNVRDAERRKKLEN